MLELRVEHFVLLIFSCSKVSGFPQPFDNANLKPDSQHLQQKTNQPQLSLSLEYALSRLLSIPYWPTQPFGYNAFYPIPYRPPHPHEYNGFQPLPLGAEGFQPEHLEADYKHWRSTADDSLQKRAIGMGYNQPQIMADDGLQKQSLRIRPRSVAGYSSQHQIIENAKGITHDSLGNDSPLRLDTYKFEHQQFPDYTYSQSLEMDDLNSEHSEDDYNSPLPNENDNFEEEIPDDYQRRSLPYNGYGEEEDNSEPRTLQNEYFQQQPLETDNLQGRKARGVHHLNDVPKNGTSSSITENEKKPNDEWLTPRFDYTVTEDTGENDGETALTLKLRCKNCTMAINVDVNYDNNQTMLSTNNTTLDLTP